MRASQRTQGATLFVSLLFVMLLLAAIMAITAQVTLSSRRSSADQQSLLAARYAAEAGVARVQARLTTMQDLLQDARIPPEQAVDVPKLLRDLCGGTLTPAPATVACDFPSTTGLSNGQDVNARVALFNLAMSSQTFLDNGFLNASEAQRTRFWNEMFSGTNGTSYSAALPNDSQMRARFGLQPTSLQRTAGGYQLFFTVPSLRAEGTYGTTTQNLSARSTAPGGSDQFFLLISQQSLARYALLTNHHFHSPEAEPGTRITFTSRTLFSGPVHTNQQFLFEEQPVFWGEVTSAGCPAGQLKEDGSGCKTTPGYGAFFGTSETFRSPEQMNAPGSTKDAPVIAGSSPQFKAGVEWKADPIRLPANAHDQRKAARSGGLLIRGAVQEMQLYRDVIGGVKRQRITYTQGGVTVQLSYGADQRLYIWDATLNDWVVARRNANGTLVGRDENNTLIPAAQQASFNGVISVGSTVEDADGFPVLDSLGHEQNLTDTSGNDVLAGILNLNGGPNAGQAGTAGASVADFAALTVATTGTINITSSLQYENPPCSGENTAASTAVCDKLDVSVQENANILGVFASGGLDKDDKPLRANVNLISPESSSGITTRLTKDPKIHAVLMASQGVVQVDGWNQGPADNSLGKVHLIGGIIEDYYGAFGTTSGTGYGRDFVYDRRTYDGYAPPVFPTQGDWSIELHLSDGLPVGPTDKGIRLQGDTVSSGQGWLP